MVRSSDRSPSQRPGALSSSSARRGGDRGFSLVEVLIAMAIMMVGLVAVAQLLAVSVQTHLLGRRTSEASLLASAKLEDLSKLNHSTAPALQVTPASPDPLTTSVANHFDVSNGYTRRWQVAAGPAANTLLVTVRVSPPANRQPWLKTVDVTTILRQW